VRFPSLDFVLAVAPPGNIHPGLKATSAFQEIEMEDFPIWLKLFIWGTIGLTVGYALWGMLHSMLQ
jgi:hypothetical protein